MDEQQQDKNPDVDDSTPARIDMSPEVVAERMKRLALLRRTAAAARPARENGIRTLGAEAFIRTKCLAGGMQDLHDVAVLVLQNPSLAETARTEARRHGALELLDRWLADRRLLQRYQR